MNLLNSYLKIKTSSLPGCGKGLFTKIFIPKGIIITEHTGVVTSFKEADFSDNNPYLFYVTSRHVIDGRKDTSAPARYINDAAGPKKITGFNNNAQYVIIDKRVFIIANRDILAGEEIFASYGKEYWQVMKENGSFK